MLFRSDRVKRLQIPCLTESSRKRDVDREPVAVAPPDLSDGPGAGEVLAIVLVETDLQDLAIVEEFLGPVTMVGVDIYDRDAGQTKRGQQVGGDREVVERAEASGFISHRVVKAAAGVEDVVSVAGGNQSDGVQCAPNRGSRTGEDPAPGGRI